MQKLFQTAIHLHQQGDLGKAESMYRKILATLPDQPDTLNALAMLCQQTNRLQEAKDLLQKAARKNPPQPHILLNLAEICRITGDCSQAVALCQKALRIRTNNPDAHFCLGSALHDQGQIDRAIISYTHSLHLRPDFSEAHNSLGAALDEQGNTPEALAHFKQAIKLAPRYAAAHINCAKAFRKMGELHQAQLYYNKAIELDSNSPRTHQALGDIWMDLYEYEKALPFFEHVLQAEPQNAHALLALGNCEQLMGHRERAESYFERSLEINPLMAAALYGLANNKKFSPDDTSLATRIKNCLSNTSLDGDARSTLLFALGKIMDDSREFGTAFSHFAEGNNLVHRAVGRPIDAYRQEFDAIKSIFTRSLFTRYEGLCHDSEIPVFILGMPRSGTTLVEQIISSHPSAHGAGELQLMSGVEKHLADHAQSSYPECLLAIDRDTLMGEATWYLEGLKHFSGNGNFARITDKMPHNFLRLGLIALLFPKAKVVHCHRNPEDNCLSLYFQKFGNNRHQYSYDLTTLGQYYRLYESLMAHWRDVLPISILDISYEETISSPEATSRKIMDFVGLPWDDACLAPHKLERTVKTASHWQVRQPIYNTSVQRWKHYEEDFGPLLQALHTDA